MAFENKPIFDVVRALLKKHNKDWVTFTPAEIALLDEAILKARGISPVKPDPELHSTTNVSGFKFSEASRKALVGVHPKLRRCVEVALEHSLVDFRVLEGVRTLEKQREYVRKGASKTMKSKHLVQFDGTAWAVDLVAIVDGKVNWDFDHYYFIARAMDRAATELGYASNIRWGAVWDRVLSDFGNNTDNKVEVRKAYMKAVEDYKKRHAGPDFLDGPHFEWVP